MHIAEIRNAVHTNDTEAMRAAFCTLADYPNGDRIVGTDEAGRAGAFKVLCEKLNADDGVMPESICDALDLAPGATFAAGAAKVASDGRA